MSPAPIRLTAVLTHPVQYLSPWLRYVAAHHADAVDLTVLYATRPTPEQQGAGFGRAFQWDLPLTEGYRHRIVRPPRPGDDLGASRFLGLDVPEVVPALRETRPQAVLVCGWYSATQVRALLACRLRGIPTLYLGDSNLATRPAAPLARAAWEARTAALLRLFTGYLVVGQRADEYLRHFGVSERRRFRAPHCVDNERFAREAAPHQRGEARAAARAGLGLDAEPGAAPFVVLFAGKLEPKKRPRDLVRAVARLGPGAALLVAGAGPEERAVRGLAEELGVRAAFPGFLNQGELPRAYAAADCLALPSDGGETWGLVVNEALATGLPAVVSDHVGCAPDLVVPGETGEVHPLGDVGALAAALARVRARINRGEDLAPACRRRVASCSFEAASAGLVAACRAQVRRVNGLEPGDGSGG